MGFLYFSQLSPVTGGGHERTLLTHWFRETHQVSSPRHLSSSRGDFVDDLLGDVLDRRGVGDEGVGGGDDVGSALGSCVGFGDVVDNYCNYCNKYSKNSYFATV